MATSPEDAVRTYLRWREDPSSVRPDTSDLEARIEAETDPLERVKLRNERARLADPGPTIEADFVAHAAAWAREHGVGAEAFLEEGVERRVLAEAGLLRGVDRTRRDTRPTQPPRRARTSSADIEAHIRALPAGSSFVTATIGEQVGGSVGTIRKVLDALLAEGVVVEAGKDHSGPGRPRTRYERC